MNQLSLFDDPVRVWSVSELNAYIRRKLEADASLQAVWLEGEISNWRPASSGHVYFTLKDANASLRCVIWKSQARQMAYKPQGDGEAILAYGRISVYEAGGAYQFYVDDLEPVGAGALHMRFERIKAQLMAEGLFEAALKQPLPAFPKTIGVVTSTGAAALRDILNVLRRRYPIAQVIVSPSVVQGDDAPRHLRAALQNLIVHGVDVIIVSRGGGSLEDLWAFNDEALAREIAACPIPVVTGIGHEVDFTIADFVADVRAPTPSAAAELVAPNVGELRRLLQQHQAELVEATMQLAAEYRAQLQQTQWQLERVSPQAVLNNYRQRIDSLTQRAAQVCQHQLALQQAQVKTLTAQLQALNPQATLDRGYAIVETGAGVVTQVKDVQPGDTVVIRLKDGQVDAKVQEHVS